MQLATGGEINAFRSTIGLAPYRFPVTLLGDLRGRNVPLLCNLSPTIIPRPCDWPESIHMDGYWFLPAPAAWTPPQALIDFLAQGDAPIYIGFGSTLTDHAEETGRIVIEALRQINRRGVLAKGWGALPEAGLDPQHFIVIDEVPHDWLFPQMAAVVHHGGAGTTAAAFHAGVPQLVIPHMQDQPYWGNKTFQLGVGAKPLPRTHLSVASLANTLQSIFDNPSISIRAKEFGARIRSEKGLEKMVAVIEHTFNP
jgi:sterol 3beta-glucosyltransferase